MSYQLLLQYLTLCVKGGHDAEALDCYHIMRGAFPALETGASSLFIKAFSRTQSWREALPILRDMKKVSCPDADQRLLVLGHTRTHACTRTHRHKCIISPCWGSNCPCH